MAGVDPRTDQEILRLCRAGRSEGIRLLIETYQERIYKRAYALLQNRDDALDATQEALMRTLPALPRLEEGRPIWPWIRRVVTNHCLNRLRQARPTVPLDPPGGEAGAPEPADPDTVEAAAEADWLQDQLREAIARLPPVERAVVVLRHLEGLSYEAIAGHLDLPLGTVKTHLYRGRRRLRAHLAAELEG